MSRKCSDGKPSPFGFGSAGPAAPNQDQVPDLDTEKDRESGPHDRLRRADDRENEHEDPGAGECGQDEGQWIAVASVGERAAHQRQDDGGREEGFKGRILGEERCAGGGGLGMSRS